MDHEPLEEYQLKLKDLSLELPQEYIKVNCPSCKSEVPAEDINIHDKIGKCTNCNVVFPFHEAISTLLNPKLVKQEVIRPEGIDIFKYGDDLDLTINQPVTGFDIIPLLILFVPLILTGVYFENNISIWWPIIGWIIFMFPVFNLINRKKHKIHINIDTRYIDIQWRPNKMIKDQRYEVEDIDQIYTKKAHGHNTIYMIVNGVNGQKHVKLLWVESLSKARYLEQEIERHLGIEDRKIPEEDI